MIHHVENPRIQKNLLIAAMLTGLVLCAAVVYWFVLPGGDRPPKRSRVRYLVFIDQSASIPLIQQEQWGVSVEKLFKRLQPGDGFLLFGIHDQTLNASPIYRADVPVLPDDPGLEEYENWKRRIEQIRRDARAALAKALNPPNRALSTDIFSALNRVQPEPDRQTVMIFLSDMLNSTRELDLERTRLSEAGVNERLGAIVTKHQWRRGMLGGAEVHCILNSVEIRSTSLLNDRIALRQFWQALFNELGANLKTFETHLTLD